MKRNKLKMRKVDASVEIVELGTEDGDCDIIGFFCEGHWDAQSFAIACNQEFYLVDLERIAWTAAVKHGFGNKVPQDDGNWFFVDSSKPREGFFPCTYVYV